MAKRNLQNELASMIAEREGKKSQVKIGDIREILAIIKKVAWETQEEVEKGVNTPDGRVVYHATTSKVHEWLNQEFKKLARAKSKRAKRGEK